MDLVSATGLTWLSLTGLACSFVAKRGAQQRVYRVRSRADGRVRKSGSKQSSPRGSFGEFLNFSIHT
eukprot:scaffold2069_cov187-Amphora_coffeaeformis.AAC.27